MHRLLLVLAFLSLLLSAPIPALAAGGDDDDDDTDAAPAIQGIQINEMPFGRLLAASSSAITPPGRSIGYTLHGAPPLQLPGPVDSDSPAF